MGCGSNMLGIESWEGVSLEVFQNIFDFDTDNHTWQSYMAIIHGHTYSHTLTIITGHWKASKIGGWGGVGVVRVVRLL